MTINEAINKLIATDDEKADLRFADWGGYEITDANAEQTAAQRLVDLRAEYAANNPTDCGCTPLDPADPMSAAWAMLGVWGQHCDAHSAPVRAEIEEDDSDQAGDGPNVAPRRRNVAPSECGCGWGFCGDCTPPAEVVEG